MLIFTIPLQNCFNSIKKPARLPITCLPCYSFIIFFPLMTEEYNSATLENQNKVKAGLIKRNGRIVLNNTNETPLIHRFL